MILRRLLFFSLIYFNSCLFAQQKSPIKFGKVTQNELDMKYYSKDSTAEAVVLYDYADVYLDYDRNLEVLNFISKYHIRIKVLKKSGLATANRTISYNLNRSGNEEIIKEIEGYTYNIENGKIVTTKLTKESIFNEHIIDTKYKKIVAMPNVKEGSVFEYTYVRKTPFSISSEPPTWRFQGTNPVLWSELNVTIPDYFTYKLLLGGYLPLTINTIEKSNLDFNGASTNATHYKLAVQDAPAYMEEPFIASYLNYISKVDFVLTNISYPNTSNKYSIETWDDINEKLFESPYFGQKYKNPFYKSTEYFNGILISLSMIEDSIQKASVAFEYISKNFKWNNQESIYASENLMNVQENKTGNSAEINLLLVYLLRQLGFDANPVILSTRDNGMPNYQFPDVDNYNYVIAHVKLGGKDIAMDATEPNITMGMLPERCLNGEGRLIKKKEARFIPLEATAKYVTYDLINATIDFKSEEIKGNYTESYGGYRALDMRNRMKGNDETDLLNSIKKDNPSWQIKNLKIENKDKLSESLKLNYDFTTDINSTTDFLYFNPLIAGKILSNPFKSSVRLYPIDFLAASDETIVIVFTLMDGYQIEELPKPAIIVLPENAGKFTYSVTQLNNTLRVSSRISINKSFFYADSYPDLKDFYDKIIQKQSEQIVFKKINK